MKNYVVKSVVKTKALPLGILTLISMAIYSSIYGYILNFSTGILTGERQLSNLYWLGWGIILLLSPMMKISSNGKIFSFTYLTEMISEKILHADYHFFEKFSVSDIRNVIESCNELTTIFQSIIRITTHSVAMIIYFVFIWSINAKISLFIMLVIFILSIIYMILVKIFNYYDSIFDNYRRKRNNEFQSSCEGFVEVRCFNNEENHYKKIVELDRLINSVILKRTAVSGGFGLLFEISNALIISAIIIYAVASNSIGISAYLVTIIIYANSILNCIDNIMDNISEISLLKSGYPKFKEMMEYENSVLNEGKLTSDESYDNTIIKLDNISFAYDNAPNNAVQNVSLSIKKGQKIGICGSSGSGKSTLLKLIFRFYDVNKGVIKFNNIDIRLLSTEFLRKKIGFIVQDPYIFNGSIRDNLLYANPQSTMIDIIEACKKASIFDFITNLPEGFNTQVGPRGMKLSGGQQQRIAIARVLLKDADVILLDEATSALDNNTESVIHKALDAFKNKTMIVVAHRLTTIKNSNNIILMNEDGIIESGTHDELMNSRGEYYKLYNASSKQNKAND